jgi:VWFA-related protein
MISLFRSKSPAGFRRCNSFPVNWAHSVAFYFFLCAALGFGLAATPSASNSPSPTARVELSALGYHVPSRMDRLIEDEASLSLDFVDQDHVLLTFDPKRLFQRLPGCTPDHQDRLMHAVILELPSGKVVKEAEWYLHDRRRYLWPLAPGTFLLRRQNNLYILDSDLQERLLLGSPKELLWVAVTPDRSQIIVETVNESDPVKSVPTPPRSLAAKTQSKFVVRFLDAKTLALRRTVPHDKAVDLNGTNSGYVDLVQHGEIWLIRFGPGVSQRHNIARVRSRTVPDVVYASDHSLLIGRCATVNCDYSVTSFSVTGRRLWRQRWSRFRSFPAVAYDQDGGRFGVSTLQVAPAENTAKPGVPAYDPDDAFDLDPSQLDIFQQDIQVFETASGNPAFSLTVMPAVQSGRNFSLSADGRRLAVLRGDKLELFDLPPISAEERTKSAELKTEAPDLFAVASPSDSAAAWNGATPRFSDGKTEDLATDAALNQALPIDSADSDAINYQISSFEQNSPPPVLTEEELEARAGPLPTFKVRSRAVVVDVVVTDGKGHPVKALKQEDFHLTEDGRAQELRSFREFSDAEPPTAPSPPPAQKPDPNLFSNKTAAPDPGSVTMVLFDLLNTPPQDQIYARRELIKFLESKPKNVQLALCTLSAGDSRLRLLQGFTPDETVLVAAARGRGKKETPQEVRWQSSAMATENSVGVVGDLANGGRTSGLQNLLGTLQGMQAEQRGTDADDRVAATVDSLTQLARYLSDIPGRKNIVWLSGSFPIFIAAPDGPNDSAAENRSYSEPVKLLSNLLAEAQVAVYPVDVRGLVAGGLRAENTGHFLAPLPRCRTRLRRSCGP